MNGMADEPTDAMPVSQLQEIDAICARFEAAWKSGTQPKVEDYLGTTPEPQRAQLQRELEKVDAEYRLKAEAKAQPGSPNPARPQAGVAGQPPKPQAFDPYYQWLGIAPKDQPPNHYRLLGVDRFEENLDVIDNAAERQTMQLRTIQTPQHVHLAQKLLNEVAAAKICLLTPAKKTAYDAKLKQQLQSAQAVPPSAPPPAPPPKVPPKNQLGEYQILAKLGSGGMGTVYKARHTKLEKTVALKVLAKGSLVDPEAVARFEREMKAVGQLNHPNIVQALDAREIAGTRFLVMEYVDGLNLAKLVEACGPLPVADACELIRQAALGLDHAHQHGLVHRDIKPANLMLDSHGQLKILDLGLAMGQPGRLAGAERITVSGQTMGTVDYMAPEQAESSRTVDIRADLYSLGCTLYKLLSGHAPFSGPKYPDEVSKLLAHARETVPPIRKVRPDVPAELAVLLDRLLAKDPSRRFATPAELVRAIAPFAAGTKLTALVARAGELSVTIAPPPVVAVAVSHTHIETLSNIKSQPRSNTRFGLRLKGLLPPRIRAPGWGIAAAAGGAALMLLAIILYISTNHGLVEIELSDPQAKVEVRVDGETIRIAGMQAPLTLKAGQHGIEVKSDQFDTGLRSFAVRRGELTPVRVSLVPKGRAAEAPSAAAGPSSSTAGSAGGQAASGTQSPAPPPAVAPFNEKKAKEHQEAWAKHLGAQMVETNSIGMPFVLIPPGEFKMGSTPEQVARLLEEGKENGEGPWYLDKVPAEAPRHHVKITKPFYLGMYPVAQGEYEKVMGMNPSAFTEKQMDVAGFEPPLSEQWVKHRPDVRAKVMGKDTSRHPVEFVNWDEAAEFCRRLSEMSVEQASRRVYRLPTEAEWEYACRAGTTTHWYCGDEEAGVVDLGWFCKNSGDMTHPVGEKKPNVWGLYDMSGNVDQWCADRYSQDYYKQSPPNDPSGPTAGHLCVLRGGSWRSNAFDFHLAFRSNNGPTGRSHHIRFRVVASS